MNENIRKLMLEAGYAAPDLAGRAIKLSELLIKECIAIVDAQRDPRNLNYSPSKRTSDDIKMHFGVK